MAQCHICADNSVILWSVGSCRHPYCYKCSFRLRELFENNQCAICKTPLDYVLITSDPQAIYNSTLNIDKKRKVYYENETIRQDVQSFLALKCPIQDTSVGCKTRFLHRDEFPSHVKKSHGKFVCDLCFSHQKQFLEEVDVFSSRDALEAHKRFVKSKHVQHPRCEFCSIHYYSSDELYDHCRDAHETCFLCTKLFQKPHHYFKNYTALEAHFSTDHFPCLEKACLGKTFVVFPTALDLQAHKMLEHTQKRSGQRSSQKMNLFVPLEKSTPKPSSVIAQPDIPHISQFPALTETRAAPIVQQSNPSKLSLDHFPSLESTSSQHSRPDIEPLSSYRKPLMSTLAKNQHANPVSNKQVLEEDEFPSLGTVYVPLQKAPVDPFAGLSIKKTGKRR